MPLKNCVVCGEEFKARLSVYKACGTACRNRLIASEKLARHTVTAPCVVCGKEFSNSGKQKKRQTCSVECGHVVRASKRLSREVRQCKTCGKDYETTPGNPVKYCSKACGMGRNVTTRPCEVCSKPFRSAPSQMHVRTCSIECGLKIKVNPLAKGVTYKKVSRTGRIYNTRTKAHASDHNANRRAAKLQATPKWASESLILAMYEECQLKSEETGIVHHVDHIVPLISDIVCGLHSEDNLQILPALDNLSKGNRHWPDMP